MREAQRLLFSPYAWCKLCYLRDLGDTEIGGFGICKDNPLLVTDICLVKQECTGATCELDGDSILDMVEKYNKLPTENFYRIWIHTHPGNSAKPSMVDEQTFEEVFGKADWAIMAILANGGDTYCRVQFSCGPGGSILLKMGVDYSISFPASNHKKWKEEYEENVKEVKFTFPSKSKPAELDRSWLYDDPVDNELDMLRCGDCEEEFPYVDDNDWTCPKCRSFNVDFVDWEQECEISPDSLI